MACSLYSAIGEQLAAGLHNAAKCSCYSFVAVVLAFESCRHAGHRTADILLTKPSRTVPTLFRGKLVAISVGKVFAAL